MNQAKLIRAVEAVLSERNFTAAAIKCGMSTRALRDLQRTPDFVALLNEAKRNVMESVSSRLINLAETAVNVLQRAVEDEMTSPLDRSAVCLKLLEISADTFRFQQCEEKLRELESGGGSWQTVELQLPKHLLKEEN